MSDAMTAPAGAARQPAPASLQVDENGRYEPYDFWLTTCGLYDYYKVALDLMGDLKGRGLLDCGCGPGHTSVMFAKRGARVFAFDTNADGLDTGRSLAAANGVNVKFDAFPFEDIHAPDNAFDLAFGSCVLHHVDIPRASVELARILRPGGKAVFIENSNRNPLLMLARSTLCGSFGIPKYGDDDEEHPLTEEDIRRVRQAFPGEVRVHHPHLVFFRLADFYVLQRRIPFATRLLQGADSLVGSIPPMRRYGYFQIIELIKHG